MTITWIGYILIPFGIFLFFPALRLKWLFYFVLLTLPYGVVSLVNFPNIPPGFGLGLDRFFAVLLISSLIILFLIGKARSSIIPVQLKTFFYLFILTIIVSFIMPFYSSGIIISQNDVVFVNTLTDMPLRFTNRNISKTVELFVSCLFFIAVYKTLPFVSSIKVARLLIVSLFVMGVTAFLDFVPGSQDIWNILKTNISIGGVSGITYGHYGEPRITGLSAEPSHLIIYAALGLAIMSAFYKNNYYIFNNSLDIFLLIFFTILVFMTFSPTMIVVFAVVGLYLFFYDNHFRGKRMIAIILLVIGIFTLTYDLTKGNLFDLIFGNAIGKMGISRNYSVYSEYRLHSFYAVIDAFKQSPIIGVGWGTLRHQVGFLFILLGSVGILGTTTFILLLLSIYRLALKKLSQDTDLGNKTLREALLLCFTIITVMCLYTKGIFYFLFLPLVFYAAGICSDYRRIQENA